MTNEIIQESEERMKKSIAALKVELAKLRTGRAHPSLLEHIKVKYYGSEAPLSQVASINVESARMLVVTPWEKNLVSDIEKAIMTSDLGLNPSTAGMVIRVPLPQLTEERRKSLGKIVRDEVEKARVAIRNIRRDANNQLKDLVKDKTLSEDDERRLQTQMQKLTDDYIAEADKMSSDKEKELMEV